MIPVVLGSGVPFFGTMASSRSSSFWSAARSPPGSCFSPTGWSGPEPESPCRRRDPSLLALPVAGRPWSWRSSPRCPGLLHRGREPRTAGDRDDPQPLSGHGPEQHRGGVVPRRTRGGGRRGLGPRPGERLRDAGRGTGRRDPVRPSGRRRSAGSGAVSRPGARRHPDASGPERDPRRPRPPGDPPGRAGRAWHPYTAVAASTNADFEFSRSDDGLVDLRSPTGTCSSCAPRWQINISNPLHGHYTAVRTLPSWPGAARSRRPAAGPRSTTRRIGGRRCGS